MPRACTRLLLVSSSDIKMVDSMARYQSPCYQEEEKEEQKKRLAPHVFDVTEEPRHLLFKGQSLALVPRLGGSGYTFDGHKSRGLQHYACQITGRYRFLAA